MVKTLKIIECMEKRKYTRENESALNLLSFPLLLLLLLLKTDFKRHTFGHPIAGNRRTLIMRCICASEQCKIKHVWS